MPEPIELPGVDGIYGPPKPDFSKKDSGLGAGLVVAAIFCLAFAAAGFFGGRATATQPTWQELYGYRIQAGCLPQVSVVGVGTQSQYDQLADGLDRAVSAIRSMYPDARNIETHLKQGLELKQMNPQAELVAYVTLERCL